MKSYNVCFPLLGKFVFYVPHKNEEHLVKLDHQF